MSAMCNFGSEPGSTKETRDHTTRPVQLLKLRMLGVGAVLSYGKDLQTGNNAFYTTLDR